MIVVTELPHASSEHIYSHIFIVGSRLHCHPTLPFLSHAGSGKKKGNAEGRRLEKRCGYFVKPLF
jgi:hypothetical protein